MRNSGKKNSGMKNSGVKNSGVKNSGKLVKNSGMDMGRIKTAVMVTSYMIYSIWKTAPSRFTASSFHREQHKPRPKPKPWF